MKYTWVEGVRYEGIEPQKVGEALDDIRQQNQGLLTAACVVEASRPCDAPLHNCFEWDNNKAADQYRQSQARTIIRSVRVVSSESVKESKPKQFTAKDKTIAGRTKSRNIGTVKVSTMGCIECVERQALITALRSYIAAQERIIREQLGDKYVPARPPVLSETGIRV